MSDLVTGEAVSLDLQPARLASRAIAFTLDLLMQGACLLLFGWGLGTLLTGVDPALGTAVVLVFVVAVLLGWPVGWETATRGRSPGKMALGLRVVRDDGGPVRFRHSLVRGLVGIFADFWTTVGCGAVISSLVSTRGKRLGDQAAGTFVVRERTPGARHVPVAMHPAAAAWAASLDLSGLTDDLALQARQYLGRLGQLDPAVAGALGMRLATEVAARVGIPAPVEVHPAEFLAAVLAERGRRAYAREAGNAVAPVGGAAGWGPVGGGKPVGGSGMPAAAGAVAGEPGDVRAGIGGGGSAGGGAELRTGSERGIAGGEAAKGTGFKPPV